MSDNSLGRIFTVTSFGESHGKVVGIIVDGVPSGLPLNEEEIRIELEKRKPGQSGITSAREEEDEPKIISGLFKGKTTGAPICIFIENKDKDSKVYEKYKDYLRPSHADYSSLKRYGGFADYRGSGRFSGRITAGLVVAGKIAKKILERKDIRIFAYTKSIGNIVDDNTYHIDSLEKYLIEREKNDVRTIDTNKALQMKKLILETKNQKDSIGGIIKCVTINMPAGIGSPFFETLEGNISKAIFSIPSVKGIEFGAGFEAAKMKGSEHNDPWRVKKGTIITSKNDSGGIIGGISIGMPIEFQVAIKPTPTIGQTQKTVNINSRENSQIKISGRHDPCIVPRAVVIVEAMTAITLVDSLLVHGKFPRVLKD